MAESNSACDCCDQPPCPTPTLEFISVQDDCDATYCPYYDYSTQKWYNVKVVTEDGYKITTRTISQNPTTGLCVETVTCSGTLTETNTTTVSGGDDGEEGFTTITDVITWSNNCTECRTTSGSSSATFMADNHPEPDALITLTNTLADAGDCSGGGTWTGNYGTDVMTSALYYSDLFTSYWRYGIDNVVSTSTRVPASAAQTITYSDEVTESDCVLQFPEYPAFLSDSSAALLAGQDRLGSSYRLWTSEGLIKTERKSKYRIRHHPTGTCYLKVWVSTIFTPLVDNINSEGDVIGKKNGTPGEPIVTALPVWKGSGNPCLKVPNDPVTADSQEIKGEEATELPVPATDGTNVVTILKWSCVEGYEPDVSDPDNKQDNGFPDPTWEASPP